MAEIKLLRGGIALVDDEDLVKISGYRWRLNKENYVVASEGSRWIGTFRTMMLHRLVMNTPGWCETDHKDGNRLDNRKSNLRIATKSQNQGNRKKDKGPLTSQFKGVHWYSRDGLWVAKGPKLNKSGKVSQGHLGYFEHETDAARAYNKAALNHWGEFALLNSI